MSDSKFIRRVVVAGGGITASTAAVALKKRLPALDVQLIETPPARDALADRIISTLPSACEFHSDVGLTEADVIARAGSGLRLGTLFKRWNDEQPDYVHAYGSCGAPVNGVPFHQLWVRHSTAGAVSPFDSFSPAAQAARRGGQSFAASCPVGLQLTLGRYGEMMRAYALHLGVEARADSIVDVAVRPEDGFLEALVVKETGRIGGDLFIDCTGPRSLLQERLNSTFIDWSSWLHCDRVMLEEAPPEPSAMLMDEVATFPFGWRWSASSPKAGSLGAVYASSNAADRAADLEQKEPFAIRQGRRRDFWVRNCVAIGDAAVSVEPLECTNLHLVHSQLDRLVAMMPGRDCAELELAQFNQECAAEADRVRDFLCLHYICSDRPEPFWKGAAGITPPPSLEHTLSLYDERGRLPYYQEETFTRDSWLTVLLSQGRRPRRIDPLAALVSEEEAEQAFASMQQSLRSYTLAAAELPELNPHGIR